MTQFIEPIARFACERDLVFFWLDCMAIFTTTDRDNVKAAIVTAAVSGFASVTIAGETTQPQPLEKLMALLATINADLASAQPHGGMRITQLGPGGCG